MLRVAFENVVDCFSWINLKKLAQVWREWEVYLSCIEEVKDPRILLFEDYIESRFILVDLLIENVQ